MFKGNSKDWRRSGIFNVNFEHILHLVLVFLLLTLSKQMPAGRSIYINDKILSFSRYYEIILIFFHYLFLKPDGHRTKSMKQH